MEKDVNKDKYTPMIQQYLEIKKDYTDAIVFFRIGDFYEMFFDDAFTASRELEIALTGKDAGVDERVPMCGIPFHAYAQYAEKLVANGHKVVIVEQIEDPSLAKGIVKRGVIKIITPGTITEAGLIDKENNYLVAIGEYKRKYLLCYADVSTGECYATLVGSINMIANEILSLHAKEIIVSSSFPSELLSQLKNNYQVVISYMDNKELPSYLSYMVDGIDPMFTETIAILLNYVIKTQMRNVNHFQKVIIYEAKDYLQLDPYTKRNLEITETLRHGMKNGSLLWHLDKCETAMGSRMMHKYIEKPLIDLNKINERLDFVEAFNNNYLVKEEIKNSLKTVYDIERIIGRIACGNANAKDLVQLRRTLSNVPLIKENLSKLDLPEAKELANNINSHADLYSLLTISIVADPPLTIKDGGMILEGYNEELDSIRNTSKNSKDWILNFEAKEKERTGIKTMKVGYNRVFGYYIEVSKGAVKDLPEDSNYTRRQTLANAERYITPELKHYEDIVINAKEKIENLEYELFVGIRNKTGEYTKSLQQMANILSEIDCYIAFSEVSMKYNYVRPTFNSNRTINIVDGRHPVLETILKDQFVKNDCVINKYNMMLITGPNMSGKSTYMRMLADIVIMAQMGSFVPAKVAELTIFDSIFTRIGASDDLISGQSTFMVEMMEANYALSNATKNSLILFDEIGRGTATFDGMALAQAILEYVHEKIGAVTLFSTHYHELESLDKTLKRLKNVHVDAKETEDGVAFLHKVKDGPIDKSYGINVASLAGLPKSVIARSKEVLASLEANESKNKVKLDLFNFEEYENKPEIKSESLGEKLLKDLKEIDVNKMSPLDAINYLYELKDKIK